MKASDQRALAAVYARGGYARFQNPDRHANEGSQRYKKGDEVWLMAASDEELASLQSLLDATGFKAGKPFAKGSRICLPIYGREQVSRFKEIVGRFSDV